MSGDRIDNVRKSLLAFVDKLRQSDRVTLVGFNQEARVLLSSQTVTDGNVIFDVIERLEAGGATNIHAGLMLGYAAVKEHYDPQRTNRVILLTDGRTNKGVLDPEQIIRESTEFNNFGIDLSVIGLGHNLNFALLRQLATAGRGAMNFVDEVKDIQKVFMDELDSLLSAVARDVELGITLPESLQYAGMYGYAPTFHGNTIRVPIENLNSGATLVVLTRLKARDPAAFERAEVKVTLKYHRAADGKAVTDQQTTSLEYDAAGEKSDAGHVHPKVSKNLAIAQMAQSMRTMARQFQEGKLRQSQATLETAIERVKRHQEQLEDKDVRRVYDILEGYRKKLATVIAAQKRREVVP
jgi:Mg-chelatase subunit ChlD